MELKGPRPRDKEPPEENSGAAPPTTNRQFEESRDDIISFQVQPGGVSQACVTGVVRDASNGKVLLL